MNTIIVHHPGNTQCGHLPRPVGTPIYLPNGTRSIGRVLGNTFVKPIRGSIHLLRRPPSIAFDIGVIDYVESIGVTQIEVLDRDSGITYRTSIELLRTKGFRFERGHGLQIALRLGCWETESGNPAPANASRPSSAKSQLSLFEGIGP